jgi:tripartite-type tricarboxylate transporter receptor subunit TctC
VPFFLVCTGNYFGLMVPKGTPADVVERLGQALARITAMPDVQARFKTDALDTAPAGAAHMDKFLSLIHI